ncbi:MAG: replication-relaxation family protein [Dissulfurispiraceae bacterium]
MDNILPFSFHILSESAKKALLLLDFLKAGATPINRMMGNLRLRHTYKTEDNLYQVLSALKKSGLIAVEHYRDWASGEKFALYALTEAAADLLAMHCKLNKEGISVNSFPSAHTIAHDLLVIEAHRTLLDESKRCHYVYKFAAENRMRKYYRSKNIVAPVPDIFVCVQFDPQKYGLQTFSLEVDLGTVPVKDMLERVRKSRHRPLILCNTRVRINRLSTFFAAHTSDHQINRVAFGNIYSFCSATGGLIGTDWEKIDGSILCIRPEDKLVK